MFKIEPDVGVLQLGLIQFMAELSKDDMLPKTKKWGSKLAVSRGLQSGELFCRDRDL